VLDYEFITQADDLSRVAQDVLQADVVGFDIETTSLDPRFGDIRLVQLVVPGPENDNRGRIYVIDLFQTKTLGPVLQAMHDTGAIFVVHNAKFEQKWMWWKFRFRMWPVFCTFRASAIIYNGKKGIKHDLDSVVSRELNEVPVNVGQGKSDWSKPHLTQQQKDYAAEDVLRLLRLRVSLKNKLTEYGLLTTALVEFGVLFSECRVELSGFHLNQEKWKILAEKNLKARTAAREELLYELPHPKDQLALPGFGGQWNVDSPQQMLASLRRLGLKIDNTPEIVLAQFAGKYPLVKKVLDYRHIAQRVKTFGFTFLRHLDPDGRIHPEYFGLLVTGRYSANKSMQQIPRGPEFRECFEAPEGRRLAGADYSGIEMRLCAEISGDKMLTLVFVRGEDAHRATAAVIMEVDPDKVTSGQRQNAKPVNFGFIYGMMPDKLVLYAMSNYGVVLSKREATKYRKRYFERYKGIEHWHRRVLREGQRNGFSRTLSGRIRYLDPHEAFNEFYNTPVQGTGADALKTSMAIVQDKIDTTFGVTPAETPDGPVFIAHHVHDEIITEADDDHEMITEVETILHDGMKEGMEKFVRRVPVVVDPSNGKSWADIH
jgi:DNA polymerase-1